eukprot:gene3795-biopygen5292
MSPRGVRALFVPRAGPDRPARGTKWRGQRPGPFLSACAATRAACSSPSCSSRRRRRAQGETAVDASQRIDFPEADASRTRPQPFLPDPLRARLFEAPLGRAVLAAQGLEGTESLCLLLTESGPDARAAQGKVEVARHALTDHHFWAGG